MLEKIEAIAELEYRTKRIENLFDFKREDVLEREAGKTNKENLYRDIQKMISPANELVFIMKNGTDSKTYAQELFKEVQMLFTGANKLGRTKATNEDFKELTHKSVKKITDYLYVIENNPQDLKDFVTKYDDNRYFRGDKHPFDEEIFIRVAEKISIINKSEENTLKLFQLELNGGEILSRFSKVLNYVSKPGLDLYGIDVDIQKGSDSREKGIWTARRGLSQVSPNWVDVGIASNNDIAFRKEKRAGKAIFSANYGFENLVSRQLLKNESLLIMNIPFYRISDVERILMTYEVLDIINTNDEYGNVVFVGKKTNKRNNNSILLQKAQFRVESLNTVDTMEEIKIEVESSDYPKNYRAAFVDMEDIEDEFKGKEPTETFFLENLEVIENEFETGRPLQEPKEGHIPTLATSGLVSGRYIDEILHTKTGEKIGFDNLIETKVIKREIEEEEKVNRNGITVREISQKKSNIIVSTALTPQFEFVELFSNESTEESD